MGEFNGVKLGPDSPLRGEKLSKQSSPALRAALAPPHEKHDQANLFTWADAQYVRWPELRLMFAIPNAGGYTGGFKKNKGRVIQMMKQGLKKGVPDIMLPVARRGFHGLFIEMKREGDEKPTRDQENWHNELKRQGYCVATCHGFVDACDLLVRYIREHPAPNDRDEFYQPPLRRGGPTSLIGE